MSERTTITNPIEIKDNSVERVAFDLMEKISFSEMQNGRLSNEQRKRDYWLKLYNQCHKVVDYKDINISKLLED